MCSSDLNRLTLLYSKIYYKKENYLKVRTAVFKYINSFIVNFSILVYYISPPSRTLQPVRGKGYEPAHKSRANAETHPRLGVGGCGVLGGW